MCWRQNLFLFIARSGSAFVTVLITAERYLVIAFPLRSSTWCTPRRTKRIIGFVFLTMTLVSVPRFVILKVAQNYLPRDIASIGTLNYIILKTNWSPGLWKWSAGEFFLKFDAVIWLPILLVLNAMVYIKVRQFARKRRQINASHAKEISAAKMFLPVVIILFVCNIEAFIHVYYIFDEGIIYVEHYFGIFLSVALNSSVNLPIYYFKGSGFRDEVNNWIKKCHCFTKTRTEELKLTNNTTTKSSDVVTPTRKKSWLKNEANQENPAEACA